MAPADCTNSNYAIKRTVTVNTSQNSPVDLSLWLKVNSIGTNLSQSNNFKYALTTDSNSCTNGLINAGSFNGATTNSQFLLIDRKTYETPANNDTYYLYIWLDSAEENIETQSENFDFSLDGSCTNQITDTYYANLSGWSTNYKDDAYREKITSVEVVNNMIIPNDSVVFNVGVSPSSAEDVKAWLESSDNDTYKLKIGANGKIKINKLGCDSAFSRLVNVSSVQLNDLDTSECTDMLSMFHSLGENVTSNLLLDLGRNFDTHNVTNMRSLFYNVGKNASSIDFNLGSKFYTENVTDMDAMFEDFGYSSNSISLILDDRFDTSKVTNMRAMFQGLGNNSDSVLLNLGNNFDTSKVTNMSSMFMVVGGNANNVILKLGDKFDTSEVTDMNRMFHGFGNSAPTLSLDLGDKFDTSKVTNIESAFYNFGMNATDFSVNLGHKLNFSNIIYAKNAFLRFGGQSTSKIIFDLSSGNFDKIEDFDNMFSGYSGATPIIYVKDAEAKQWLLDVRSEFYNTYSPDDIIIKSN